MVLKEEKNSLSFIVKAFNLSTVEFIYLAMRVLPVHGGQDSMLHVSRLSDQFCIYICLNCVFLLRGSRITDPTK